MNDNFDNFQITEEQANSFLSNFAENKVKLISFCKPKVTNINNSSCTIKIPLNGRV